jgi:DNA-binding transcriptional regulator WhiA
VSFASDVKTELISAPVSARHCSLAEISALLKFAGITPGEDGGVTIRFDGVFPARRLEILLPAAFGSDFAFSVNGGKRRGLTLPAGNAAKLLAAARPEAPAAPPLLVSSDCCKKAYLRGAFLAAGQVSLPLRFYHAEIGAPDTALAETFTRLAGAFGIAPKLAVRGKKYSVYLKESEQIADFLKLAGAVSSLMEFENARAQKDVNNLINRQANYAAANMDKTISAAAKQVIDIEYIKSAGRLSVLPPHLRRAAELRLSHNHLNLKELGELFSPVVSKSGMNHRMRKISQIAEELRKERQPL